MLRITRLRTRLLLQLLLLLLLLLRHRGSVQPDTTRATGQSTDGRGGLLLRLLLLPLLLLRHRGPVQPDTTRATSQSTEGRGDLLLRLLLQISSASIPGELLLLLLMRRLLLLPCRLDWLVGLPTAPRLPPGSLQLSGVAVRHGGTVLSPADHAVEAEDALGVLHPAGLVASGLRVLAVRGDRAQ